MSINHYVLSKDQTYTIRGTAKLLNVANAKYSGSWKCAFHTHEYTELFYIVGGTGLFLIEEQQFPVCSNNIVIVNPKVPHAEVSINAQPLEYLVLGIEGIELASGDHSNGDFCVLDRYENAEIASCFRNILREMEQKNTGFEDVCQAYMEILAIRLMRSTPLSVPSQAPVLAGNRHCAAVKHYIDLHFKEALTLEQLAEKAHMNKYYLSHSFKREYGVSPINYMITRRIEESKYLLAETDLSLSQIAHLLGFSSQSYFSQVFRRTQEVSPMEYRQNTRAV